MYIHDLDLAKAKREAPAYTFIVYYKTIYLEPLQKKSTNLYFRGRSIWFSKESVILEKKKEYKQSWNKKILHAEIVFYSHQQKRNNLRSQKLDIEKHLCPN